MQNKTRHINGVKTFFIAGVWYADYQQYQQTKAKQGIRTSIDAFLNFCDKWDLSAQG